MSNSIWKSVGHPHDVGLQVLPTFYLGQGLPLTWTLPSRLSGLACTTTHNLLSIPSFHSHALIQRHSLHTLSLSMFTGICVGTSK